MSFRRTKRSIARPTPKIRDVGAEDAALGRPEEVPSGGADSHLKIAPAPADDPAIDAEIVAEPPSNSTDLDPATLWLRRADQFFLGFLVFSLLALLVAFRWRLAAGGHAEIEITNQQPREFFYAIEINQASWVEWAQLDGIGEKLARRIVEDRTQRGPFKSIDDISRVRGLGTKLIEKLRPFLKCDDEIKELR